MPVPNEPDRFCPPCLIVALNDPRRTVEVCRSFRRLGWDVYEARNGLEARRLAHLLEADCVLLDANLPAESGWLTCAKLVHECPVLGVVLVVEPATPRDRHLGLFLGARVVGRNEGTGALIAVVTGPAFPQRLAAESRSIAATPLSELS